MDRPRRTRLDVRLRPVSRAKGSSLSDGSLRAYASPPYSDSSFSEAYPRGDEFTSSCVTTLMVSPGTEAFFCDNFLIEEKSSSLGEVGVKGPPEGLGEWGGTTGKGIDEALRVALLSRPRNEGVLDGPEVGDGGGLLECTRVSLPSRPRNEGVLDGAGNGDGGGLLECTRVPCVGDGSEPVGDIGSEYGTCGAAGKRCSKSIIRY